MKRYADALRGSIVAFGDYVVREPLMIRGDFPFSDWLTFERVAIPNVERNPVLYQRELNRYVAIANLIRARHTAPGVGSFWSSSAEILSYIQRVNTAVESLRVDIDRGMANPKDEAHSKCLAALYPGWAAFYGEWAKFNKEHTTGPLGGWTSRSGGVYEETAEWGRGLTGWEQKFASCGTRPTSPGIVAPVDQKALGDHWSQPPREITTGGVGTGLVVGVAVAGAAALFFLTKR